MVKKIAQVALFLPRVKLDAHSQGAVHGSRLSLGPCKPDSWAAHNDLCTVSEGTTQQQLLVDGYNGLTILTNLRANHIHPRIKVFKCGKMVVHG
jgi:hypothetical protein